MKRTWLILAMAAVCIAAGCAAPVSQAHTNGVPLPRPTRSALAAATPEEPGSVKVSSDVMQQWAYLYRVIDKTEFALCLEGRIDGRNVVVENFRLARVRAFTRNAVSFEPCESPSYIGMAHNHPDAAGNTRASLCYFSAEDQRSFEKDKRATIDIVVCGETQFVWQRKRN
jgi:hypothetical protein